MKTMSNHHHSNPLVSIISGAIFGISAFLQNHGFIVDNLLELFKVIIFGLIGGACGFIGKNLMEKYYKRVKDKCKDL